MFLCRDFIEATTVSKINSNFSLADALFPLSLIHMKGHRFLLRDSPFPRVRWFTASLGG